MCPSGGRVGGVRDRLRRLLRDGLNREYQPVILLLPAVLLLLFFVYCFPLLSALVLCVVAGWAYRSSGGRLWRLSDWGQRGGGAAGARLRAIPHRRLREPVVKWSPASLLLLMGSYLGKQEPPARGVGRGARELKERLTKPNPTVPTPARRLSFRETPVVTNRPFMSPRRRYPTHQPQYSMVGSLPTVYGEGFPRKTLLSPKHSQLRSPVTVKIARPDQNIVRSPVLNSLLSPSLVPPPVISAPPDPCAKETVLNAIRESRKRMNKDEYGASGGLENKRRRQISDGSGESPSDSPVVNGSLSYVSKSDSLKRAQNTQLLDDIVNKRSRTSSNSSLSSSTMNGFPMATHNAITSSFSSSRILLQKRKRNCQNTSVVSSSPSSRCQTPDFSAKKAREELHEVGQSSQRLASGDQSGQLTDSSKSSTLNSPGNGSGGPRRKKVLLVCSGRGDQYPLPPPPVVGYNITSKDLDSEKKAFLQRLNKALEETTDPVPASSAPSTTTVAAAPLFSLSTTSSLTSQTSTASSNPLLQSLAKMQSKDSSQEPSQAVAADFTSNKAAPIFGLSTPKSEPNPNPNVSLQLTTQPAPAAPGSSTSQSANAVQNKPESKSSLLQLLTQPSGNESQSSFKPLFPSNVSPTPASVSSSGLSMPSVSTTNTFKPIFGDQVVQQSQSSNTFKPIFGDSSVQQPATSASPFTFQANSTPASTAPPSFSGFGAPATSTTSSALSATKSSLSLPTSSSATTNFSSTFPGAVSSSSSAVSAPTNTFLGSGTSSDSQTKTTFVFGQAPTSQATPSLNMFGNTQTAATSQPQASVFGSSASAFSATLSSNPPPYPASSGASTFTSSSGSGVQADKPASNPLPSFGTSGGQSTFGSGTQPTFGSSSQTAFGANTQPTFGSNANFSFGSTSATTNPTQFGTLNSTQTNSTPATNQFGASPKLFGFGDKTNSATSFGVTTSTVPAPTMTFGNSSVAQNNTTVSFGTPGPTENKLSFGTPSTPFGQTASPAAVNFGTSTPTQTPSFGSPGASFGQANHGFSIGVTSKTSGARQRLMARRQHTRKK
ncbi:nuclear envelope pore membrane protein POM 121 [Leptodactylus fuscus]|uniref:nuclear envelope pore membrane protein POM 121 n=1 Tax=Leptodactylus fuscus TaxID=238119 RepID=UPI003F4EF477